MPKIIPPKKIHWADPEAQCMFAQRKRKKDPDNLLATSEWKNVTCLHCLYSMLNLSGPMTEWEDSDILFIMNSEHDKKALRDLVNDPESDELDLTPAQKNFIMPKKKNRITLNIKFAVLVPGNVFDHTLYEKRLIQETIDIKLPQRYSRIPYIIKKQLRRQQEGHTYIHNSLEIMGISKGAE